ncbi:MAG: hypothetical protein DRP35_01525 [Candidatus Zixiibacteriota bacterium]|nr:MAG: hypothetical protein DRP35_01525 [candidate division Zixibacteria bacterium]
MKLYKNTFILFLLGLLIAVNGQVYSESGMTGTLGMDVKSYSFNNLVKDSSLTFNVKRVLSNHFLNLSFNSPLMNENFANLTSQLNLVGSFYNASNEVNSAGQYISPDLNGFFGQITFFPLKRFPLQLYRNSMLAYDIRYESGNRTDIELVQPSLAVVRRYESDKVTDGSMLKINFHNNFKMMSEYKQDRSETVRNYDFGEDNNIWVDIINGLVNPIRETDTIKIVNMISDDSVSIHVDLDSIGILDPFESITIVVDSGYHNVRMTPRTHYNQLNFRIAVHSNSEWEIVYNEPGTPNDIDQVITTSNVSFKFGSSDTKFKSDMMYEYSDQNESNQILSTLMNNFSNSASYKFSNKIDMNFLTTYTNNKSSVDTLSAQKTDAFSQMTTLNYLIKRNWNSSFSHSYNKNKSDNGIEELSGDVNIFTNSFNINSRKLSHKFSCKNNVSLTKDSKDYQNNQYSTNIINSIEFRKFNFIFTPKYDMKLSRNTQKNPTQGSNEIDSKLNLVGEIFDTKLMGDVKFNTGYSYRKKIDDSGSDDIKRKYLFDIIAMKKFNSTYKVMFLSSHIYETYGGSTPVVGPNPDQQSVAKPGVYKSTYKIDLQVRPNDETSFSTNFMFISQEGTSIKKIGFTFNATLPYIKIPLKSYIIKEFRALSGLPTQTQTSAELKFNIQFRQISVIFKYNYTNEDLIVNKFSFHQITGKLTRNFNLF